MVNHPIVFAGLTPHAPILIPGVAGSRLDEVRKTVGSMQTLSKRVVGMKPDTLVLISPHSPRHQGEYGIWRTKKLHGSFSHFSDPRDRVELPLDGPMADAIETAAREHDLKIWSIEGEDLDHGATVPLWYLAQAGWTGPTVVLSLSYQNDDGLNQLGRAISAAAARVGKRCVVIASGDMSHRLTHSAPCGYEPRAHFFDESFVNLLRTGSYSRIPGIDARLQSCAAEDVIESTLVAAAATDGVSTGHEVLSYEGPFGVGYCVAVLYCEETEEKSAAPNQAYAHCEELPVIARKAIEDHWEKQEDKPDLAVAQELAEAGCVFVTLYNPDGSLRGCIGTLRPCKPNIALETWHNARSAAFGDSRFKPVARDELAGLRISVTVLGAIEPISSARELDPSVYGVVVHARDGRRGVLLPDIEGVNSVQQQVAIARRKAGIGEDEEIDLHRFKVRCFEEDPGEE